MASDSLDGVASHMSTGAALLSSAVVAGVLSLRAGWPPRWFSFHPLLMFLAFVCAAWCGIAAKQKGGRTNTLNHAWLLCTATLLSLAGWYVIYEQKNMNRKLHNTSWHAWLGLATIGMYVLGACGGLSALHPDFGVARKSKLVRTTHRRSSRFATAVAFVACVSGYMKMVSGLEATVVGALLAALAAVVLLPKGWRPGSPPEGYSGV